MIRHGFVKTEKKEVKKIKHCRLTNKLCYIFPFDGERFSHFSVKKKVWHFFADQALTVAELARLTKGRANETSFVL